MDSLKEINGKIAIPKDKQMKESRKNKNLTKLLDMSNARSRNSLKEVSAIMNTIDNISTE